MTSENGRIRTDDPTENPLFCMKDPSALLRAETFGDMWRNSSEQKSRRFKSAANVGRHGEHPKKPRLINCTGAGLHMQVSRVNFSIPRSKLGNSHEVANQETYLQMTSKLPQGALLSNLVCSARGKRGGRYHPLFFLGGGGTPEMAKLG